MNRWTIFINDYYTEKLERSEKIWKGYKNMTKEKNVSMTQNEWKKNNYKWTPFYKRLLIN